MGGPNYHSSLTDGTFDNRGKPPQSKPSTASTQAGAERLASISRKDGAEELRVESKSYNGYPYIDLRVWFQSEGGEWRPTKVGVTVKMRELDEVIAALTKARGR
jgi:hypothetical protein